MPSEKSLVLALGAEFIGTLLLTFLLGGVASGRGSTETGLATVFIYATLMHATSRFSGGHLNPVITLVLFLHSKLAVVSALTYIPVQLIGAIAGSAILRGCLGADTGDLGATYVSTVDQHEAFGIELLITFFVVLVYFGCIDWNNSIIGAPANDTSFIYYGFATGAATFFAFSYTGASFNPARSFGPAVISNVWHDNWVYWAGPVAGSLFALGLWFVLNFFGKNLRATHPV